MFLKRFVFVHWGNIPDGEFDLGPVNLFSGANGSGKTSAGDALQTVMTAAHEHLFHYNPGQEETTQRGRGGKRVRTLASYVLGCDDGSYARTEPTDGYLAAVFHPTRGEDAERFTAVIGVRAWLDQSGKQPLAREEALAFFILPEVELEIDAFLETRATARHTVLLDELQQKLIARYGQRAVERYDQKRAYLRRLYAALRGKRDSVSEREALAAARAFSRFMAYKPVSSINQFVADEVLERKDLGEAIRSVSSQLKTIHGLEREAQGLKDSAQRLESAGHHTQSYLEGWIELNTREYARARAAYLEQQSQFLRTSEARERLARDLQENLGSIGLADARSRQLRETLISLEAQRKGIAALQQKDALDSARAALEARLKPAALQLLTQAQQVTRNRAAAKELADLLALPSLRTELPALTDLEARRVVREALEESGGALDVSLFLQQDLTHSLARLEAELDQARRAQRAHAQLADYWQRRESHPESRRDTVAHAHQGRRQHYAQLTEQATQKEREIARLEAKQVVYPAYVERALDAIRVQCPQADVRVLCDHIEVTEARWQAAIEGYLGGARFALIVDPDYEAQAIRIVRALSGRDNRARVIQGSKALRDAARVSLPADSIVHVLTFTHAVAQAYLSASYGSVVRVQGPEALRQTARGVTVEGMASGSYSMFRCDVADADLVFGAAARERALRARKVELERLTAQRQEANLALQDSARLLQAIDALGAVRHADCLAELLEVHRELRRVELQLESLQVDEHEGLEAQLLSLRAEEDALRAEEAALHKRTGELQKELNDLQRRLAELGRHKEEAQAHMAQAERDLTAVHTQWPEFDLQARLQHAEAEANDFEPVRAGRELEEVKTRLHRAQSAIAAGILEHNQKCRPSDALIYTAFAGQYDAALFVGLCELRREIDRIYNILRNNVLIEKHEQLKSLKTSFNEAFVSHLCQEIHQSLRDGERQLELLNRELTQHRFGSDRERFRFAHEWVPEFREYAQFLKEVVHNPALGEGEGLFETRLSPKSTQVRERLMALLLGEDEHKSLQELERIADYRNYHRYEIYKEVEGKPPIALSEYGTGSGGQLETPAYIIRSASITSALRYAEGTSHLRMVLVDEAFSKMDESRSREVIDYLTRSLGLQLVFIMPTSKCGPFMDLISNEFVFAKVPSAPRGQLRTRVLVDRKQCAQERIGELWQHHRRTVREQAELDFLSDVVAAETAQRKSGARA